MTLNLRRTTRTSFLNHSLAAVATTVALVSCTALAQDRIATPQFLGGGTFVAAAYTSPVFTLEAAAPVEASSSEADALPDSPGTQVLRGSNVKPDDADKHLATGPHVAKIYTKYIPEGWTAQPLTAHDKVIIGIRDSFTPYSFAGIILSAAYSHVTNGSPNYGTDKGAFGQRLGATAIRDTSENILADSVFAPIFHEDPRYYVEGAHYNFFHRLIYAATRPIITRTDGGRQTINAAQILGDASASAISYSYYPSINQNFKDTAGTFGGALGGDAIGCIVSEFSDEFLVKLHLKKAL